MQNLCIATGEEALFIANRHSNCWIREVNSLVLTYFKVAHFWNFLFMINGSKNCFFVCLQIFLGLLKKAKVHPQKSSKNSSVGIFCIEKETGSSCRRFLLRTHWLFSRVVLKKKVKLIATFMACCHRWTPAKKSDHLLRKNSRQRGRFLVITL